MKVALAIFVSFLLVIVLPPVVFSRFEGDIREAAVAWALTLAIVAIVAVVCVGFVAMWEWAV